MIIAIDGPAGAGKGTLARALAETLDYAYLDTGLLYRATGLKLLRAGADPEDPAAAEAAARSLTPDDLEAQGLREESTGQAASQVAAIPAVRQALLEFQRRFAENPPHGAAGAVLDGRDIGTVVCPDAPLKFFVTADVRIRAERRFKELKQQDDTVIYARVLQEMEVRDSRDSARKVAPLDPAGDAVLLDTSDLDAARVFDLAMRHVRKHVEASGPENT